MFANIEPSPECIGRQRVAGGDVRERGVEHVGLVAQQLDGST